MLAEQGSDPSDAISGTWRPKPWEVTAVEGYQAWKLRVDTMIATNTDLMGFVGIDEVTESMCESDVPGFTALAPAEKAQILQHFRTSHMKLSNAAFAKVLATIDLSKDGTLLRKIHSDYAPHSEAPCVSSISSSVTWMRMAHQSTSCT